MHVICLCGIEHEIDDDTELVECAACGQRFDLGKATGQSVRITVSGTTFDAKLFDFQRPTEVAPVGLLRLGADFSFSQPMSPVEFMDMLVQLYLHERRN